MKWKVLSSKIIWWCPYFKVWKDECIRHDDVQQTYWVVRRSNSAFVVPITENQEVYFIKQYRHQIEKWTLEIPGGGVNKGEYPLKAARRELWEETGLKAKTWSSLGRFSLAPGLTDNICYGYIATDLLMTDTNKCNEEGIIEIVKIPLDKINEKILNGKIDDGPTLAVLAKLRCHFNF